MAKFYNIEPMWKTVQKYGIHYIALQGGRNIGKSYQVKYKLLSEAYINNTELIYLRREAEDIKTDLCRGYFADVDVKKITEGEYDTIIVYQKKIYWARTGEDGVIEEKKLLGYTHALRLAGHQKSVLYPNVTDIIFEEFIPDGVPYLPHEPLKLQEYCSTIFRTREGRCWLIGNTISKLNPYAVDWELEGLAKMKAHQIDVYTRVIQVQSEEGMEEHEVRIAVEMCAAEGLLSKMAFGSGANQIVKNEFRKYTQPTVTKDYIDNCCELMYEMYLLYKNLSFKMLLMCITDDADEEKQDTLFWYVKPAKSGTTLKTLAGKRCITDAAEFDQLHTGLWPVSGKESKALDLLAQNKIFYSDDMTGTDFVQCLTALRARG